MMRATTFRFSLLPVLAVFAIVTGCSDSATNSESPPEPPPPPEPVESISPQLEHENRTSELIGPDGGSVLMTDTNGVFYALDIAPGVLPIDVEVSMTPVIGIPDLNFAGEFYAGVQLEPEGLYFVEPAILTLEIPSDADPSQLVAFGWRGTGESVYLEPIQQPGFSIRLPISHFSGAGVAAGEPRSACAGIKPDGTMEARYKCELAEIKREVARKICDGDVDCLTGEDFPGKFNRDYTAVSLGTFDRWLAEIEGLVDDTGSPDLPREPLVRLQEYYAWKGMAEYSLCSVEPNCSVITDNFGVAIARLRQKLTESLIVDFEEEFLNCDDLAVHTLLYDKVIYALGNSNSGLEETFAEALDSDADIIFITEKIKEFYRCNLEIDVSGFPDALIKGDPDVEISVQLRNKSDVLNLPVLGDLEVSFSDRGGDCGEIDGTSDTIQKRFTDANGRVTGVKINANNCADDTQKVVLTVSVEDNIDDVPADEPERFFYGNSVRLETDVVDPCASAPQGSSKFAAAVSRGKTSTDTCEDRFPFVFSKGVDDNSVIVSMNGDGSIQTEITISTLAHHTEPDWSPDGSQFVYTSDPEASDGLGNLYIANADGSGSRQLTNNTVRGGGVIGGASWSPDGSRIAYEWNGDIFVANSADGSGVENLTQGFGSFRYSKEPDWTTDGAQIVFSSADGLAILNLDGSGISLIPGTASNEKQPQWSPDGSRIVFVKDGFSESETGIHTMNPDGSDRQYLSSPGAGPGRIDSNPVWSPDGTQIAFSRSHDNVRSIFIMNADGTNARNISNSPFELHSEPAWRTGRVKSTGP